MGNLFAILAAVCNASIGILSRMGFNFKIDHISLAFYRSLFAFLFLSAFFLIKKDGFKEIMSVKKFAPKILITSFLGIFILYYFEIWALTETTIPIVSFLLYASGIIAVILGIIWLKESFKFKIPGKLAVLWWLFGFGSVYLLIPFVLKGIKLPSFEALPVIISLALIPTIGGYYCTSKALLLTESSKVQLFEMSEPVFASIFAFILFREILSFEGYMGGFFIIVGLTILEFGPALVTRYKNILGKNNYTTQNKEV